MGAIGGICEENERGAFDGRKRVKEATEAVAALFRRSRLTLGQGKTVGAPSLRPCMSFAFGLEDGERSGIGRDIQAIFRVVHGDRINDAPGSLGLEPLGLPQSRKA